MLGTVIAAAALSTCIDTTASAAPHPRIAPVLTFCTDANFQGACKNDTESTDRGAWTLGDMIEWGAQYQDAISSVRNLTGRKIVFYEHNWWVGRSMTFPASTQHSNLAQTGWANDVLSSYRPE
ncbi:hypothetical protein [Streptomyces sp. NPDC026673]|uniref:hypothetical protein n=1 Tax=Streptomyces sp. NPDC026673 TaxID=3155724 RepID=UPI0033E92AEA